MYNLIYIIYIHSDTQNRELHDSITRSITQTVCTQVSAVVISELQKHVLPIVAGKLEGIKTQIQSDIAQKITITDRVIKENISNICRSKVSILMLCEIENIIYDGKNVHVVILICL